MSIYFLEASVSGWIKRCSFNSGSRLKYHRKPNFQKLIQFGLSCEIAAGSSVCCLLFSVFTPIICLLQSYWLGHHFVNCVAICCITQYLNSWWRFRHKVRLNCMYLLHQLENSSLTQRKVLIQSNTKSENARLTMLIGILSVSV